MQSYQFALVVSALVLAFGCRGSNNPPAANNGENGEPPPVVDNGNDNGNKNVGHPSTVTVEPGRVVDPTRGFTTEREIVGKMDMPELIKALGDKNLAPSATDELATRGDEAVEPLIEALDHNNDAVRQRAIFTLGRLGPAAKAALPKLQAIADDSDDEVQSDAAKFAMDAIEGK